MNAAVATPIASPLEGPVTTLRGVGPERAAQLARLKIVTVEDLLLHRPRRYEDRRHFRAIADLELNDPATARGRVVALGTKRYRSGTRSIFELILDDGTGRLHCRWWNLPFMEKYFAVGDEVIVFGKPILLKPRTIDHPETEVVDTGEENFVHFNRITPVYPLTEGLPQRWLRSLIWRTLQSVCQVSGVTSQANVPSNGPRPADTSHLTSDISQRTPDASFPSRSSAIRMLHFPEAQEDVEVARRRLALDEFIELQRRIRSRRQNFETKAEALPCGGDNRLIKPFLARLGFKLTDAQTRVLREIRGNLRGSHPMRRLLQGDVGSGKTVVAACSALMAIESGHNVAVMAPTEILAGQHYRNFSRWCEPLGVRVELQTGSRKTVERSGSAVITPADRPTAPGASTLFVGTHALFTAGFDLPRLGLVIIDEQHKFGVAQREQLVRKGRYPHLLVMTATPIPRTLGLTLYGDLDVSTIDAPPPGRGGIRTFVRTSDQLPKVWSFVRNKLREGRQAYVICPRVEDSGPSELKAVVREFENVRRLLAPHRVGLLHGRLRSREKDEVMAAFRANTIQALLTTSLIEVGVDVPNATVMLIENAGQFGLAQLHQLRGRIGRGAHESYCVLVAGASDDAARRRLKILEETTDGFQIAEADLALRGPGDLLGQEQSGLPDFRFGNLVTDSELIRLAQRIVAGQSR